MRREYDRPSWWGRAVVALFTVVAILPERGVTSTVPTEETGGSLEPEVCQPPFHGYIWTIECPRHAGVDVCSVFKVRADAPSFCPLSAKIGPYRLEIRHQGSCQPVEVESAMVGDVFYFTDSSGKLLRECIRFIGLQGRKKDGKPSCDVFTHHYEDVCSSDTPSPSPAPSPPTSQTPLPTSTQPETSQPIYGIVAPRPLPRVPVHLLNLTTTSTFPHLTKHTSSNINTSTISSTTQARPRGEPGNSIPLPLAIAIGVVTVGAVVITVFAIRAVKQKSNTRHSATRRQYRAVAFDAHVQSMSEIVTGDRATNNGLLQDGQEQPFPQCEYLNPGPANWRTQAISGVKLRDVAEEVISSPGFRDIIYHLPNLHRPGELAFQPGGTVLNEINKKSNTDLEWMIGVLDRWVKMSSHHNTGVLYNGLASAGYETVARDILAS